MENEDLGGKARIKNGVKIFKMQISVVKNCVETRCTAISGINLKIGHNILDTVYKVLSMTVNSVNVWYRVV